MTTKDRRREMRLSGTEDDLIAEAAGLAGVSVSEFVLNSAVEDAERLVNAHRTITFTSPEARSRFAAALDAPFIPNKTFQEQVRRARRYKTAE
ncbi:MAG: DUF1778 domain-containing protein [Acidimicrobiales bacterium]